MPRQNWPRRVREWSNPPKVCISQTVTATGFWMRWQGFGASISGMAAVSWPMLRRARCANYPIITLFSKPPTCRLSRFRPNWPSLLQAIWTMCSMQVPGLKRMTPISAWYGIIGRCRARQIKILLLVAKTPITGRPLAGRPWGVCCRCMNKVACQCQIFITSINPIGGPRAVMWAQRPLVWPGRKN